MRSSDIAENLSPTGIQGLDSILSGGLPRNRLYLIQGKPGSGKTTLALQFLLEGARRGEKGLYITLSETLDELESVAQSHGWDLNSFDTLELSAIEDQLGEASENTFFHPSEIELNKTVDVLLKAVERVNPQRVVLDSLSEFRLLAEVPLRYRRQMLKLKQYFARRQCTVLLLDDQTGTESDLHIQSIAHGVISLERVASTYGVQRRQLEIEKLRGLKFREGAHDYRIEKGGLHIFPRLIATEHLRKFSLEPSSSGIPEFDALLGGGLDRGTSNLFLGPAGTGKSTLAMQHAVAAAERGENAFILIFDESERTLATRAAAVGIPLARHLKSGRIQIQKIDPSDVTPGEFAAVARAKIEEFDAKLIVIDSLNGYLNSMPDENFLSLQLHELLAYLSQQGVVSILTVAQHGLVGTMQSPVDITYLADTVILLRFFESDGQVRKAISAIKKRSGYHEDTIRELVITGEGIKVGKPLKDFRGVLSGVPVSAKAQA